MHVTFDSLKTFYNILLQKLKNHRGNWNQNDPIADDYIKNRPFYSEEKLRVIVPEQTINGFVVMEEPIYGVLNPFSFEPVIGDVYKVMWDGEEYTVAFKFDEEFGLGCIGNKNYMQMMSGGDVPFAIIFTDNDIFVVAESTKTSHDISISTTQEVVKQIDPKYVPIPNDIATEEYVEELVGELGNNLADVAFTGQYSNLSGTPSLASVATTGSYNDLSDLPEVDSVLSTSSTNPVQNAVVTNALNDKMEFTSISLGNYQCLSMCYGDGKYVVVGYNTHFMYSTNGITWYKTETVLPNYMWDAVCYGNGKFIAIASNTGYTAVSTDGVNWTLGTKKGSNMTICFCGDKFFYFSRTSAQSGLYYSDDGLSWTITNLSGRLDYFCYENGKYLAVGGDISAYSTDGINWTQIYFSGELKAAKYGLCYGDGKFVMPTYNGTFYSTDGLEWTKITSVDIFDTVIYGDELFVANHFNTFYYSYDGINWIQSDFSQDIPGAIKIYCYGNGKYIASYYRYATHCGYILYSTDGIKWIDKIIYQSGEDKTADIAQYISMYTTNNVSNDIALHDTVSGAESITIEHASSTEHELSVSLSSETYTDFSNITVVLTSDNGEQTSVANTDGSVTGLHSEPSFTLSLQCDTEGFDASQVSITCTYQLDLNRVLHDYVLHVDMDGEAGSDDVDERIFIDETLSITGAAADAKATGEAISNLNNTKVPVTRTINGKDLSEDIFLTADDLGIDVSIDVSTDKTLSVEDAAADAKAVGEVISNLNNTKVPTTRTINGKDLSTDIIITAEDIGAITETDTTLTIEGVAADAKAVGEALENIKVETDNTLSIEGAAADAKATGDAITSLNNLVGTTPVSEQIAEAITEVYVQNEEPSDAPDGSIWVDLDADGAPAASGKVSANVYVVDAGTTDITTIDFSQYAIGDVVVVTAS